MELLKLQGETDDVKHTSWRITSKDPAEAYKLRGLQREQTIDESSQYKTVFQEGEKQAADLRTEEFVKRCFYNPNSELFHALTAEHYAYLVWFWQSNKVDGQWCYDKWTMDEDPAAGTYPTLKDLPAKLNNFICPHVSMVPRTGQYPPDEYGNLQSFESTQKENFPKDLNPFMCPHMSRQAETGAPRSNLVAFRVMNDSTGLTKDIFIDISKEMSLESEISENVPYLMEDWSAPDELAVERNEAQKQCIVWDDETNKEFHSFSLNELKEITARQLTELFPFEMQDPIKLIFRCVEVIPVGEDEEDI